MQITVYSVIMTALWSNLLIISFSILQRNHRFLDICSVSGMIMLYSFCVIRMFIPIEFSWVNIIHFNPIFNTLQKFFNTSVPLIAYDSVEVVHILSGIWIIVSITLFIQLVLHYFRLNQNIAGLSCTKDEKLDKILREIGQKEKKSLKVEVVKSQGVNTPLGVGIIRKKILIPNKEYNSRDLFYILRHEYMHHKNQDLFVQLLVNILCVLYWWDPFVYLLRKNIEHGFEMRCDQMVVRGMNDEEIADYLETLLKVFRLKNKCSKSEKHVMGALGIIRSNRDDIRSRFQTLSRESAFNYKTYGKQVAAAIMVTILILSYSFIIQPEILPSDTDMGIGHGVYELEPSGSYIMHHTDGSYELITSEGDHVILEEIQVQQMMEDGFQVIEENRRTKK